MLSARAAAVLTGRVHCSPLGQRGARGVTLGAAENLLVVLCVGDTK